MKSFWVMKAIKGTVLFLVFAALISLVVMWLWNSIIPGITGWKMLTFWEAAGLFILSKILFGFRGGWGGHWRHHRSYYWKKKWEDKLSHMNPEEREKIKAMWKDRWCRWEETPSEPEVEKNL